MGVERISNDVVSDVIIASDRERRKFLQEAAIMSQFDHQNVGMLSIHRSSFYLFHFDPLSLSLSSTGSSLLSLSLSPSLSLCLMSSISLPLDPIFFSPPLSSLLPVLHPHFLHSCSSRPCDGP
jgi:hypothetical protein